jgi:hypothetical protein
MPRSSSLNSIHGMSRWSLTFVSEAFRVEVYFRKLKLFRAIVVLVQVLMGTIPFGADDNKRRWMWCNYDDDDDFMDYLIALSISGLFNDEWCDDRWMMN